MTDRTTPEPVAYLYEDERGNRMLLFSRDCDFAREKIEQGWAETPLYAGPMVDDASIERVALAILNSDREAAGFPAVASRENIPDSHGYVRNAHAAIAAITEASHG